MSEDANATQRLTETSYKSEAWHYRHGVVTGIIFLFSLFYLAFRGVFGAIGGFFGAIFDGWTNAVLPFMRSAGQSAQAAGKPAGPELSPKRYN